MPHAPYYYHLGPWVWRDDALGPRWESPAGCVGAVDLGALEDLVAGSDRRVGFFACRAPLDSAYDLLAVGDCREIPADARMRETMRGALHLDAAPAGDHLVDLLWDCLTAQSDPEGLAHVSPLVPTVAGRLELWLPGHSLVKAQRFAWGKHPHTAAIKQRIRSQFRAAWKDAKTKTDRDHLRRALDYQAEKYRLVGDAWRELIDEADQAAVGGRLKHQTTYADAFNRANGPIGGPGGWTWTTAGGGYSILSNQAKPDTGSAIACTPPLSGDDHYAQLVVPSLGFATTNRMIVRSVAGIVQVNGYLLQYNSFMQSYTLLKYVGGNGTQLAGPAPGETYYSSTAAHKIQADGSTITVWIGAPQVFQVTDTGISGSLVAGMMGGSPNARADDFQSGDLALPPVFGALDCPGQPATAVAVGQVRVAGAGAIPGQSATAAIAGRAPVAGSAACPGRQAHASALGTVAVGGAIGCAGQSASALLAAQVLIGGSIACPGGEALAVLAGTVTTPALTDWPMGMTAGQVVRAGAVAGRALCAEAVAGQGIRPGAVAGRAFRAEAVAGQSFSSRAVKGRSRVR